VGEVAIITGRVRAISISAQKGVPKTNVPQAELRADYGLVGDAHAGSGPREVSLLAGEQIDRWRRTGAKVAPGDFAENITTQGLDLRLLRVGSKLKIGHAVELEITQLGKRCHGRCAIFERLGDCIMPREGAFARVVRAGCIQVGDAITIDEGQWIIDDCRKSPDFLDNHQSSFLHHQSEGVADDSSGHSDGQ
jgi:molybdopterin adenylyltransferase